MTTEKPSATDLGKYLTLQQPAYFLSLVLKHLKVQSPNPPNISVLMFLAHIACKQRNTLMMLSTITNYWHNNSNS